MVQNLKYHAIIICYKKVAESTYHKHILLKDIVLQFQDFFQKGK